MTGEGMVEYRSCGCTVWPVVMFEPVRSCGKCGRGPEHFVGDGEMSRTAAYEVARRTGLLDPDAPKHECESRSR